ncbi:MAG: RsmE family RNA methyltransferase, partial [Caldilineaceae bacterium]
MHRFFVSPGSLRAGALITLDEHAHQLHSVLRLQGGAALLLLDGSGLEYEATLTAVASRHAAAQVGASRPSPGEPRLQVALYLCTLKADKFDWVLQKGTELGVSRFVPVVSRRSVVRPASALASKLPRWQAIVREASEQSRRGRLPLVEAPLEFDAAVAKPTGSNPRWIAWEE